MIREVDILIVERIDYTTPLSSSLYPNFDWKFSVSDCHNIKLTNDF